jgi:long-chain fatty acid transport protein
VEPAGLHPVPMTRSIARPALIGISLIAAGIILPGKASAGGFYIPQQSVDGVGRAFVGNAAIARDPATVFSNPAGMTALEGPEISVGASGLFLKLDLDNEGSTARSPGTLGAPAPVFGNNGGDPIDPAVIPNIYVAFPAVDHDLWLGIGLTMPFGISVDYTDGWFGRYDSVETSLTVVNIGPVAAYRITDYLSIGGGIDIQHADAKLTNAIPDPFAPGGPSTATDGSARLSGDDWAWGFNAGVLIEPSDVVRIGVHYRSAIDYNIDGNARVRTPTSLGGTTSRRDAETDLDMPDIVTVDIAYEATPKLTLLTGGSWFGWSRFDELRIKTNDMSNDVRDQDFQNSITAGVAAEYALDEAWTLRSGFQFDQTPTRNSTRSTALPDGDRYWLAAGVGYAPTEHLRFDLAYAHTFFEDADVDRENTFFAGTAAETSATVRANASNRGDTIAGRLLYRF